MRRTIAALAAVAVVGTALPAPVRAAGLWDIGSHWARAQVEAGLADGYIEGYPDGSFRPDRPIARGEFFKLLAAGLQLPARPGQSAPYAPRHWAVDEGWAQAAVAGGLLNPRDYSNWIPLDTPIPRREIVLAAVRAVGMQGLVGREVLTAPDAASYPDWLQSWAAVAVGAGLLEGYDDGSLGLERTATRAEALVIAQRILQRVTMRLAPAEADGAPNLLRYPAAGEPTWSVQQEAVGRPRFSDGTQTYGVDGEVSRFALVPAPGGAAWLITATPGAGGAETYRLSHLKNGMATEVASYHEPIVVLTVGADGRLWFSQGANLVIAAGDGRLSAIPVGERLRYGALDGQGNLWAVGLGPLYQVSPEGQVTSLATRFGDQGRVRHLAVAPDGSLWLIMEGTGEGDRVEAVRIKEGEVIQRTVLIARQFGGEGAPLQAALLNSSGPYRWVIAVSRPTGSAEGERSLFRFDLDSGTSVRLAPPRSVGARPDLLPAPDGGALLQDASGKFWRILQ